MSNRLELLASLCLSARGIADVGTDHGLLPALLRLRGYSGYIAASDIKPAPLGRARQTLEQYDIDDVDLVLCDGLDGIDARKVDAVVIAGMGGDTISGILDRGLYDNPAWIGKNDCNFMLHPVTKPEILRYWLINNGMAIIREDCVEDNGVLCRVISVRAGSSPRYRDAELFTGKYELICDSEYFDDIIDRHISRFEAAARGIRSADNASLNARLRMLEQMLRELKDMKGEYRDKS